VKFYEIYHDSLNGEIVLLDSLNISEEVNVLDIPNAVPFELPTLAFVDIHFVGDFTGVQDTIYYWVDYIDEHFLYGEQRVTEISQIGKNQSQVLLLAFGVEPMGAVRGYVFILDSDNDNAGIGYVAFKTKDGPIPDTVWVDAAKNTVCYTKNSATTEFEIKSPAYYQGVEVQNFMMDSRDYDSYQKMNDRAICVLSMYYNNSHSIFAFSTFLGYGKIYTNRLVKAYGFAPHFLD